ncbi:hypothetical protein L486_00658 [Kwoniella mangroviensis CBS 10435]|uniref:Uncharacterized protein n=1 Tax=Kwoniella mangroviensis CBS 10435 TaxID=1331196 RepID=A0A1B9J018_9TREE|nr:hypothetical protein L486_00658 [Kwoniella mangroviensis CBS 10435]
MGADGGSIPDRRDLVRTKAQAGQTDKSLLRELYILCALSKKPLSKPVVLDPLGKLYNKDAILEYFLDKSKYGDGEQICGHLKGIKDLITLNLTPNPDYSPPTATAVSQYTKTPFICPLSLREMSGAIPFLAIKSCGCVFSDAALRGIIPNLTKGITTSTSAQELTPERAKPVVPVDGKKEVTCPNCGKGFEPSLPTSIIPINPPKEVQDLLLENLLLIRASAKPSKKRKNTEKSTSSVTEVSESLKKVSKISSTTNGSASPIPRMNSPAISGNARSVQDKLAEQEKKRLKAQENMSEAVKSMFKPKDNGRKKSGADDFFGRTFTRVSCLPPHCFWVMK